MFVREAGSGAIEARASEVFQKLIMAVEAEAMVRGKAKGSLVLKVIVEADNAGNGNLTFAVDKKEPTKLLGAGPVWITKGSNYALEPPTRDGRIREVARPKESIEDEDGVAADDESEDTDEPRPTHKPSKRSVRTV